MMQTRLRPQFVEFIPEHPAEGVLYICEQYRTAVHKCCCGCGGEVVTPLTPADWSIRKDGDSITLNPSIGNWSLPCQSHYWIKRNQVVWARGMSQREIGRVRERDRADKEAYVASVNRKKDRQENPISTKTSSGQEEAPLFDLFRKALEWLWK